MVTHNQIASATQALDPDSIVAFATSCSQHSSYRWLQAVEVKKYYSEELNKPFLAAYLLEVSEAFEMISARELLISGWRSAIFARMYCTGYELAQSCLLGMSETWEEVLYITHD